MVAMVNTFKADKALATKQQRARSRWFLLNEPDCATIIEGGLVPNQTETIGDPPILHEPRFSYPDFVAASFPDARVRPRSSAVARSFESKSGAASSSNSSSGAGASRSAATDVGFGLGLHAGSQPVGQGRGQLGAAAPESDFVAVDLDVTAHKPAEQYIRDWLDSKIPNPILVIVGDAGASARFVSLLR
jgi:hypothetical protein